MTVTIAEILAILALVGWVSLAFDRRRSWPSELQLRDSEGPTADVRLVAVVPARNESDVLRKTLPSLLKQHGPRFGVVMVDDSSDDGTGRLAMEIARELGAEAQLRVLVAPEPSPGWAGKVHALESGVNAVPPQSADWFLFTDADVHHRAGTVRSLLHQAMRGAESPFDLVSVMPRLRTQSFWEKLLIPAFSYFFNLLYPFREVQRTASPTAAAAGGCLLLHRGALEEIGGFAALHDAVIDDIALAQAVKATGHRIWLGLDPEIESVRAYHGLRGIWRMIERSAFAELKYKYFRAAVAVLALGLFVVSPPWILAGAVGQLSMKVPAGELGSLVRSVFWVLLAWWIQVRLFWPAVKHHGLSKAHALTLPFAAIFYAFMTMTSAWQHFLGRGVSWKGRSYSASEVARRP